MHETLPKVWIQLQCTDHSCSHPCKAFCHVQVQQHPTKTSAIVLFSDPTGCKEALEAAKTNAIVELPEQLSDDHALATHGLRARVEQHKQLYPGNEVLQKQLDQWMADFEAQEERQKREAEAAAAADEGWTVVTKRAGRKRKAGAHAARLATKRPCRVCMRASST